MFPIFKEKIGPYFFDNLKRVLYGAFASMNGKNPRTGNPHGPGGDNLCLNRKCKAKKLMKTTTNEICAK